MIRYIGKILVAGAFALAVLSGVSYFYSYTGIHVVNDTGATDYKWQPKQWKATASEGFAWFHMDSYGFNNEASIVNKVVKNGGGVYDIDNLLMGSSHMEAINLPQEKNVGFLLNQELNQNTYNIGTSGHNIYRCVDNLRDAYNTYKPTHSVIIEIDRVIFDMKQMQEVIDGKALSIPSYDQGIVYQAQRIPGLKWVYKQLIDWISQGENKSVQDKNNHVDDTKETDILNQFLSFARASIPEEVSLIIVYQPRTAIDENGEYLDQKDLYDRDIFSKCCKATGINFIDMTNDFKNLYITHHILAHGFHNSAVGVGHLNEYGHRIIAQRLSEVIREGGAN